MATAKTRAASKKKAPARSRSAARSKGPKQTATTAGDNQPGAGAVNEKAAAQAASVEDRDALAHPKIGKVVDAALSGEPLSSLNSVPKDEGGLPHDELARLRAVQDQITGAGALGQPGQKGHGVGTAPVGAPMTEEEAEADHAEYVKRFS